MGIQAPGPSDYQATFQTALLSYNRPLMLGAIFLVVLVASYFLSKKNLAMSLVISIAITLAAALFFVVTYSANLRY